MRVTVLSGYGAYAGFAANPFKKVQAITTALQPTQSQGKLIPRTLGTPKLNASTLPSGAAPSAGASAGNNMLARIRQANAAVQAAATVIAARGPAMTTQPVPTTTTLPTTLPETLLQEQPPVINGRIPDNLLYTPPTMLPTTTTGQSIPVVAPYEVTPAQPLPSEDPGLVAGEPSPSGGLPGWVLPAAGAGLVAVVATVMLRRAKRSGSMDGYRGRGRRR